MAPHKGSEPHVAHVWKEMDGRHGSIVMGGLCLLVCFRAGGLQCTGLFGAHTDMSWRSTIHLRFVMQYKYTCVVMVPLLACHGVERYTNDMSSSTSTSASCWYQFGTLRSQAMHVAYVAQCDYTMALPGPTYRCVHSGHS